LGEAKAWLTTSVSWPHAFVVEIGMKQQQWSLIVLEEILQGTKEKTRVYIYIYICVFLSSLSGEDSHFDTYFSNGLKPPLFM